MGDHRADIKLEMTIHGKKYETEMWINYCDTDGSGCDYRVVEFFANSWADALARFKLFEAEHQKEIEQHEREELARLQEKYPCRNRS